VKSVVKNPDMKHAGDESRTTDDPERQSRNQNRTATPKSETAAKGSGSGCGFAENQSRSRRTGCHRAGKMSV